MILTVENRRTQRKIYDYATLSPHIPQDCSGANPVFRCEKLRPRTNRLSYVTDIPQPVTDDATGCGRK
jgi:hypothetical protein